MLLNRFFRLEMVKGTHNYDPMTLNAPFRAARHPGLQNNNSGVLLSYMCPCFNITSIHELTRFCCFGALDNNSDHVTP